MFEEIFPPELFTIVASVVPFTSIAVIPVALIVPEFVTVKSEVLSANILTVVDVIVDPDSTVTSTLFAVTLAGFVAPVFNVELSETVKNSPSSSIFCWLVVVPPLLRVALSAKATLQMLKKIKVIINFLTNNAELMSSDIIFNPEPRALKAFSWTNGTPNYTESQLHESVVIFS